MRQLLLEFGYNEAKVCAAYADGDRRGAIPRKSDKNAMTPDAYAAEVWKDGHRDRSPWILAFCKQRGIRIV
jgi:hypothetical protein